MKFALCPSVLDVSSLKVCVSIVFRAPCNWIWKKTSNNQIQLDKKCTKINEYFMYNSMLYDVHRLFGSCALQIELIRLKFELVNTKRNQKNMSCIIEKMINHSRQIGASILVFVHFVITGVGLADYKNSVWHYVPQSNVV